MFLDGKNVLYNGNTAFHSMFGKASATTSLQGFAEALLFERAGDIGSFLDYVQSNDNTKDFEMLLENSMAFKVSKKMLKNRHKLLCFNDISAVAAAERELNNQNSELLEINQRLDTMAQKTRTIHIKLAWFHDGMVVIRRFMPELFHQFSYGLTLIAQHVIKPFRMIYFCNDTIVINNDGQRTVTDPLLIKHDRTFGSMFKKRSQWHLPCWDLI